MVMVEIDDYFEWAAMSLGDHGASRKRKKKHYKFGM